MLHCPHGHGNNGVETFEDTNSQETNASDNPDDIIGSMDLFYKIGLHWDRMRERH